MCQRETVFFVVVAPRVVYCYNIREMCHAHELSHVLITIPGHSQ
jgi:hypothetical protein